MADAPNNAATKEQIRQFFKNAVERSMLPDHRAKARRIHEERAKKVPKTYGF